MTNSQMIYKPFSSFIQVSKLKLSFQIVIEYVTYVQVGVRSSKWPTDNKVTPTIN